MIKAQYFVESKFLLELVVLLARACQFHRFHLQLRHK